MNRFEIIGNEADHESIRELLQSRGFGREWHCSLKVGDREEGLEIWVQRKGLKQEQHTMAIEEKLEPDVAQCVRCSDSSAPRSPYCEDCKATMEGDDDE